MHNIFIDGASKGNPGPSGAGAVCYQDNRRIFDISKSLGKKTNNEAEYLALELALKEARARKLDNIIIYSDSQILVNQITM